MSSNYREVKNGKGTTLNIDSENYVSVGPGGIDVSIRSNGKTIHFESLDHLISAVSDSYVCSGAIPSRTVPKLSMTGLEDIMKEYGVVLRAIPHKITEIMEARHASQYPNGRIVYLPEYKREMLIVERVPKDAGKFIFDTAMNTLNGVRFGGWPRFQNKPVQVYDTIEDAIADLLKQGRPSCNRRFPD